MQLHGKNSTKVNGRADARTHTHRARDGRTDGQPKNIMSPAPISSGGTQRKKERQKSETAKSPKYHLAAWLVGSQVVGRQLPVQIYDAVVHFHVMLAWTHATRRRLHARQPEKHRRRATERALIAIGHKERSTK